MASFVASKFNAETDSDRPQIDSVIDVKGENYIIKKVDWIELSKTISDGFKERDLDGFDSVFYGNHSNRLGLIWIIWANKQTQL